jgi:hypothetical protein
VELSCGERLDVDRVLWGTGYEVDLGFFDEPALASIIRVDDLARRCGSFFRSLDAPNLFFLAGLLDGTGSATWAYSHAARTIVSHIQGLAHLPNEWVDSKGPHFDLIKFLAQHDAVNFPPDHWFAAYRELALAHPPDQPLPIP